jgi:hypothetical protein
MNEKKKRKEKAGATVGGWGHFPVRLTQIEILEKEISGQGIYWING